MSDTEEPVRRPKADDWLAALPDRERAHWLCLRPADQDNAVKRIDAILRFNDPDDPIPLAAAVEAAGTTRRRFYQLLQAWRLTPGLKAVGVKAAATPRRVFTIDEEASAAREAVLTEMRRLLSQEAGIGTEAALRRVMEVVDPRVSRRTLLDWWTRERRLSAYGRVLARDLALDVCELAIVDERNRPHLGTFVVDPGARVILGGAAVGPHGLYQAYFRAAADAARRMDKLRLTGIPGAPRFERAALSVIPGGSAAQAAIVTNHLCASFEDLSIFHEAEDWGGSVRGVCGPRLGRLRLLGGGNAKTAEGRRMPVGDHAAAELTLRLGLDEHQREAMAAIPDGGRGATDAIARLTDLLARLAEGAPDP